MREFVDELDTESLNVVDVAAALAAAALLGVASTVRRLVPQLSALQEEDGSWPAARWFVDRVNNTWRSAPFSTALAVEALALAERTVPVVD